MALPESLKHNEGGGGTVGGSFIFYLPFFPDTYQAETENIYFKNYLAIIFQARLCDY